MQKNSVNKYAHIVGCNKNFLTVQKVNPTQLIETMKTISLTLNDDKAMWDIWMSMYQISAVTVANEIGLFKLLDSEPLRCEKISEMLKINYLGLKALANVLAALKFLNIKKDRISLSPIAHSYLLQDSPFYWGAQFNSLDCVLI